jgi:hypothetical protein
MLFRWTLASKDSKTVVNQPNKKAKHSAEMADRHLFEDLHP